MSRDHVASGQLGGRHWLGCNGPVRDRRLLRSSSSRSTKREITPEALSTKDELFMKMMQQLPTAKWSHVITCLGLTSAPTRRGFIVRPLYRTARQLGGLYTSLFQVTAKVKHQLDVWGFKLPTVTSVCILDYPISRPGALCPRVDSYVKALALECWRRSTHRGGELRASLETGSSLRRWPLAPVDSSLWEMDYSVELREEQPAHQSAGNESLACCFEVAHSQLRRVPSYLLLPGGQLGELGSYCKGTIIFTPAQRNTSTL